MVPLEQFKDTIRTDMTAVLATAACGCVTLHLIHPVYDVGVVLQHVMMPENQALRDVYLTC